MIYFWLPLLFFIGLHILVAKVSARGFTIDLAFSRSMAACLLVILGFTALWLWWPMWRQAFLLHEPDGAKSGRYVAVLAAHLVADQIWLIYGRLKGESVRIDLLLHHLLGLVACATAWALSIGYTLIAVLLTTEMLPVVSGFLAWARARGDVVGERLAQGLGLGVLLGWRLPCWLFLSVVLSDLWTANGGSVPRYACLIALAAVVVLVAMDLLWTRSFLRLLRRPLLNTTRDGGTGSRSEP